ncbi:MAG TPA: hypothetical protein VJ436_12615, partial [Anaerolineales bacterium]|nr:hypothetical protein [Anaerolineales bacterium]
MERTVPSTASEEIELYQRTYYSLLRSTAEVQIRALEEAHTRMKSLLHMKAPDLEPDMSAFVYCLLRLPACMPGVSLVVLGQSTSVFTHGGFENIEAWEQVSAPARRRRCFYNGKETLACFIASRTDIDDVIPLLTAYQIEWNKIHWLIKQLPASIWLDQLDNHQNFGNLAEALKISEDDLVHLQTIWGPEFSRNLKVIAATPIRLRVQLLSGSFNEYRRATRIWWENVQQSIPHIHERPVYFVSSNPHSVVNLLSGFAQSNESELLAFLQQSANQSLLEEWNRIQAEQVPSSRENFLYYTLKKYQQAGDGPASEPVMLAYEQGCGILRIPSRHSFDVETRVIELSRLNPDLLDGRLDGDLDFLWNSDALILNIDYPLGMAAYNILSKVAEQIGEILGVYITGKAATLNGVIGDVMIPNVVHDEQSQNTYLFPNAFIAADVAPFLIYGTVMDNQKTVSVRGTFLQNAHYMDVFYREGYTDIEM